MLCLFLFKWDFASKESNISFPFLQFKRGKEKAENGTSAAITDSDGEGGGGGRGIHPYTSFPLLFPKDRHEWADNGKKWESFKLQTSNYFIQSSFRSPIQYSRIISSIYDVTVKRKEYNRAS